MNSPDSRSDGVHSEQVGDGPTRVAFCHGLFGRGKNFTGIAKAMGEDYSCLLMDMPDHGRSVWTEKFDYLGASELVAEHLGRGFAADGPVDLVGHSMGGKIAMLVALRHPEVVRRLVVADIGPGSSGATTEFEHLLGSLSEIDLTRLHSLGDADRQLAERVPSATLRGFLLQNLRRTRGADGQPQFFWQPQLAMLRRDLPTITSGIPVTEDDTWEGPVLWVAGSRSDYVREQDVPLMRELFPRVVRVTIKDAGHWVHSEQPKAFVTTLQRFLAPV